MGAPTWTKEEDHILTQSRRDGRKFHEIARLINRTRKACAARYAVLTGDPGIYMANAANDNIRRASDKLGRAINELLAKMPPEQRAFVIGADPQRIPGSERVYRGQHAERTFARPIGEIIAPIVANILDKAEAA